MKWKDTMVSKNNIKIPPMRDTLIHYLNKLSDHELQRVVWSKSAQQPGTHYDNLDYPLTFLYDDTDLATNSESWIGEILKNKEEMHAVDEVINAIDAFFERYREDMCDSECIEKPEWRNVLEAAKKAHELIKGSEPAQTASGQSSETG